jgi:hypothetical protein
VPDRQTLPRRQPAVLVLGRGRTHVLELLAHPAHLRRDVGDPACLNPRAPTNHPFAMSSAAKTGQGMPAESSAGSVSSGPSAAFAPVSSASAIRFHTWSAVARSVAPPMFLWD